jgi:hypothetical protein
LRTDGGLLLEFEECLGNVAGHGHVVDGALGVVPFKCDAEVAIAFPFFGAGVERFEASTEVLGVFVSDIVDAEIVNDSTEGEGTGFVTERPGVCLHGW